MKLVLTYELPDRRKIQIQLLANQSVTIGKSDEAEHPIYMAAGLDDVHFRVATTDEECWLTNLALEFTSTWLNGSPVRENELHDGDQILAGGIVFHVMLSDGELTSATPPRRVVDAAPALSQSYQHRIGRCGLHEYHGDADDLRTEDVMLAIHSRHIFLYLLINFKAAGRALPSPLAADDDLFQHAPAEIRQEHSMHLVASHDIEQTLQLFSDLSQQDAVVCVLTDKQPGEFLRDNKLFMAWFARPSLLGFHLSNASDEFIGRLMSNVHGVLMESPGKSSWTLTTNPKLVADWKGLGFAVPPH